MPDLPNPTLSVPSTFTYDVTNPTKYQEQLAWLILKLQDDFQTQGGSYSFVSESEINDYKTDFEGKLALITTALSESFDTETESWLPTLALEVLPQLPVLFMKTWDKGAIVAYLAQNLFEIGKVWLETKIKARGATGDLEKILKLGLLEGVDLNDPNTFALLKMLAFQPISININEELEAYYEGQPSQPLP